jgi:hypothetical protein
MRSMWNSFDERGCVSTGANAEETEGPPGGPAQLGESDEKTIWTNELCTNPDSCRCERRWEELVMVSPTSFVPSPQDVHGIPMLPRHPAAGGGRQRPSTAPSPVSPAPMDGLKATRPRQTFEGHCRQLRQSIGSEVRLVSYAGSKCMHQVIAVECLVVHLLFIYSHRVQL